MKIVKLAEELKKLKAVNQEIRYRNCVEEPGYSVGLIEFQPKRSPDSKQINHPDKDVLCHVLKGKGRLRIDGKKVQLKPGMMCHIPKGTPHDFASGRNTTLVLFYSLITHPETQIRKTKNHTGKTDSRA